MVNDAQNIPLPMQTIVYYNFCTAQMIRYSLAAKKRRIHIIALHNCHYGLYRMDWMGLIEPAK